MKKIFLALLIFLSSCSVSSYWSDDVYFSLPSQRENGYIDLHDRYLRMKSRDSRWSQFDDDFWYWNTPRQNVIIPSWRYSLYDPYFGYNRFSNPFFPQIGWTPYPSIWYNPYNWRNNIYNYNPYVFTNTKPVVAPKLKPQPRTFNLNTYGSNRSSNYIQQSNTKSAPVRVFNNTTTINSNQRVTPQTRVNTSPIQPTVRPSTNAPVRKF